MRRLLLTGVIIAIFTSSLLRAEEVVICKKMTGYFPGVGESDTRTDEDELVSTSINLSNGSISPPEISEDDEPFQAKIIEGQDFYFLYRENQPWGSAYTPEGKYIGRLGFGAYYLYYPDAHMYIYIHRSHTESEIRKLRLDPDYIDIPKHKGEAGIKNYFSIEWGTCKPKE